MLGANGIVNYLLAAPCRPSTSLSILVLDIHGGFIDGTSFSGFT
jgi:hypothetical protein